MKQLNELRNDIEWMEHARHPAEMGNAQQLDRRTRILPVKILETPSADPFIFEREIEFHS